MIKKNKYNIGDVFELSLNNEEIAFGQIVALSNPHVLIISMFDFKVKKSEAKDLKKICSSNIVFLGYALDALLHNKHWKIIGNNNENLKNVLLPVNKIGSEDGEMFITNFKGEIIKSVTKQEFNSLDYMTVHAPIIFEDALNAHFGLLDWESDFDDIKYRN